MPGLDVRRASERFTTAEGGTDSRHSFSFGAHYDPANVRHALLLAHNEERVLAGAGFGDHPHRDTEILTWVLSGSLVHQDSTGEAGVIRPGLVQRLGAGTGVVHSERNDPWSVDPASAHDEPVRFVQMWLAPQEPGLDPEYEQADVTETLAAGGLVPVASGMRRHRDTAAIRVRNEGAALHVARLGAAGTATLPDAPYLHLFVSRGGVDLEGVGALGEGDAVRFTGGGGHRVSGTAPDAEILVWEMHAP